MSILLGYKSKKAAQISAFFAGKSNTGIDKLKLIKLLYLAERTFLSKYGHPMFYDEFYSLRQGPICSISLDGINGLIRKTEWSYYIQKAGNTIKATSVFAREDFDHISDAEHEVAKNIWEKFGGMTTSQVRNYTHRHCPEYTEVSAGRIPISYKEVFDALDMPNAEMLSEEIEETRRLEAILSGS